MATRAQQQERLAACRETVRTCAECEASWCNLPVQGQPRTDFCSDRCANRAATRAYRERRRLRRAEERG